MKSESSLSEEERLVRASECRQLLESKHLNNAFDAVRDDLMTVIVENARKDEKVTLNASIALEMLANVKKQLYNHVETGQLITGRFKKRVNW